MSKKHLPSSRVPVSYESMVSLRQQGKLNLGISNDNAAQLIDAGIKPTGPASAAYKSWIVVAFAAFVAGLYFAFTKAWWWGLVGFIAMGVIGSANKKGNSQNLLDAAMDDRVFYERVLELGGWIYEVEEDVLSDIPGAQLYITSVYGASQGA